MARSLDGGGVVRDLGTLYPRNGMLSIEILHETPQELSWAIEQVRGRFQADCRGLGAAWQVAEVWRIAEALMGGVELIRTWDGLPEDFARLMEQSMGRGVADAQLRVWSPQGAEVLFVKQVSPTLEDLSPRRTQLNPLTGGYDTGAWGDETRDYHVAVRLAPKAVGQEQLASRVQLAVGGTVEAQGLVKARWSADSLLTAQISPEVAHYTGQTELASAIQDGLRAKAIGDDATATSGPRSFFTCDEVEGGHVADSAEGYVLEPRRQREHHLAILIWRGLQLTIVAAPASLLEPIEIARYDFGALAQGGGDHAVAAVPGHGCRASTRADAGRRGPAGHVGARRLRPGARDLRPLGAGFRHLPQPRPFARPGPP